QLYRLALLAELYCRVSRARRQEGHPRQRRPNSDSLAELRHPFPPWTKIARLPRAARRVKNRNESRNTGHWAATRHQTLRNRKSRLLPRRRSKSSVRLRAERPQGTSRAMEYSCSQLRNRNFRSHVSVGME